MTIKLFENKSDNAVLNKNITEIITVDNVVLLDNTNIITPTFRLNLPVDVTGFNYCWCDVFQRYYYIVTVDIQRGGIYQIDCTVDVLMSFQQDILNLSGVISRAGTNTNSLIADSAKIPQANTRVVNKKFSGGELLSTITAVNNSFVLTAYGGII